MFPTPPPTRSIRSRERDGSSGQDSSTSGGSRIDSHDSYRMGGPGLLPSWPIRTSPAVGLSAQQLEELMNIALTNLGVHDLEYQRVMVEQRYSKGHTPTPADNTLSITLNSPSSDRWVEALDDMLSATQRIGFVGRIEIVDWRARGGIKSFPPDVPEQFVQEWEATKSTIVNRLASLGVDWRLVTLERRGYWESVAQNTIVIKALFPSRTSAILARDRAALAVDGTLDRYNLQLEVSRPDLMWGLFAGSDTKTQRPPSLGWPFNKPNNMMGLSIARTDAPFRKGTLGGYLTFKDRSGNTQVLGLTCYHVIATSGAGEVDSVLQKHGSKELDIPCQSPAGSDVQVALEIVNRNLGTTGPIPSNYNEQILARAIREAKEKELQEVTAFNPNIGSVAAASGFRNIDMHPGFTSPSCLLDWAVVHIKNGKPCLNFIGDIDGPPGQLWRPEFFRVSRVSPIPPSYSDVVKRGRTTGVTFGIMGGLLPAAVRVDGYPAGLHHRGWTVLAKDDVPFAEPGDSGAWVLDTSGQVIGLLFGGDAASGSGIIMPMSAAIKDIEESVGIPNGSLELAVG